MVKGLGTFIRSLVLLKMKKIVTMRINDSINQFRHEIQKYSRSTKRVDCKQIRMIK